MQGFIVFLSAMQLEMEVIKFCLFLVNYREETNDTDLSELLNTNMFYVLEVKG